jgi:hypothetical protein
MRGGLMKYLLWQRYTKPESINVKVTKKPSKRSGIGPLLLWATLYTHLSLLYLYIGSYYEYYTKE